MTRAAALLDREKLGLSLFLLISLLLHLVALGQWKMGGDIQNTAEEAPSMAAVEVRLVPPEPLEIPVEETLPPPIEEVREEKLPPLPPEELALPPLESEVAPAEASDMAPPAEVEEDLPALGDVAPLPREPQPIAPTRGERILSWEESIRARLAAAKRYPRRALKDGIEGEGQLQIRLGVGGQLLEARLHSSTGDARLDREILAMAERAAPFAPPPSGEERTLLIPVTFHLR